MSDVIQTHMSDNLNKKSPNTHIKLQIFKSVFGTVNNFIKQFNTYIAKGYFIDIDKTEQHSLICLFYRNAIINIDFTDEEYINLNNIITSCTQRYFIVYGSITSFNEKTLSPRISGGHIVSIIIDLKTKSLTFFDPIGFSNYSIFNRYDSFNTSILNIILALELSKNVNALNGYTFYYNNLNIQSIEHNELYIQKIYNYNFKQKFRPEKQKLRDWAGGYCGLWNYLYIFLLVINPHLLSMSITKNIIIINFSYKY